MKKYRPSNGTEGMYFMDKFCDNCIHENPESGKSCDLIAMSMCYDINDTEYPKEWCYNDKDEPTCTKWIKWDWGKNGDPNDPENPLAPLPDNPDQLVMPFIIEETLKQSIHETNSH